MLQESTIRQTTSVYELLTTLQIFLQGVLAYDERLHDTSESSSTTAAPLSAPDIVPQQKLHASDPVMFDVC